ncbi:hypothetical protein LzC2_41770 [Planctomycetes bacterium LzC2]|uniref:GspL cytoplasmic actin-ATPase-like domain-containing protein n=1 Tax=Alienimonas chondri TaxID=2681879 RepID=A0ABX1VP44_9PLAN|nr:hypothetical protein [Alienimonas chondri]
MESDLPGAGAIAGPRARAERRGESQAADRRQGGDKPESVPVERRRRDRRSGPKRTAGLELSPSGLSLAISIRDGSAAAEADEHADPNRKEAEFYGAQGFAPFTDGSRTVCRFRPWPPGCGPMEPGFTREVLAEAFAAATADLGPVGGSLSGVPVDVALGGALCVTRVLTAPHEEARREAAALADRAGRYLGLGRGEKTCVTAEERLDAKMRRVRVTVAPRQVASDVLHVLSDAGLRPGRIEHTLATLSAGLHARGTDGDRPVLLLAAEGDRLYVAAAHRGRLLLDYRPVGHHSPVVPGEEDDSAAASAGALGGDVLLRHQKRIRRYVANQLRGQPGGAQFFADAEAAENSATGHAAEMRVYVTGGAAVTRRLSEELDPRPDLAVGPHPAPGGVDFAASLDDADGGALRPVWSVGAAVSPGPLAAVMLACGATASGEEEVTLTTRGDLSTTVRPHGGIPWADLARVGWPVAAALLLSAGLWGMALRSEMQQEPLEQAVRLAQTDADMAGWLRGKLNDAAELERRTETLAQSQGTGPVWVPALVGAGTALVSDPNGQPAGVVAPRRAWLEEFLVRPPAETVDPKDPSLAEIAVVGGGHTDADVFRFADRLRRSGRFAHVQLAATREARYATGPGVRFELTAAPTLVVAPAADVAAENQAPSNGDPANVAAAPDPAARR